MQGHIFMWDSQYHPDSPELGHMWLVLAGSIHHITGTNTVFYVSEIETGNCYWNTLIPKATPTEDYPLFNNNTTTGISQSQPQKIFLTDKMKFNDTGGVGRRVRLTILDFLSK